MKQLYQRVPCGHCELRTKDGTRGLGCLACHYLGYRYEEVDPAELDKMNLVAVKILEELRAYLAEPPTDFTKKILSKEQLVLGEMIFASILRKIGRLESSVDLKPLRETLVQAKAWEMVFKEAREVAELRGISSQKNTFIARLQEFLAQARAELDQKGGEK